MWSAQNLITRLWSLALNVLFKEERKKATSSLSKVEGTMSAWDEIPVLKHRECEDLCFYFDPVRMYNPAALSPGHGLVSN